MTTDPHVAWAERDAALSLAHAESDEEADAVVKEPCELSAKLRSTPVITTAGAAARLRWVLASIEMFGSDERLAAAEDEELECRRAIRTPWRPSRGERPAETSRRCEHRQGRGPRGARLSRNIRRGPPFSRQTSLHSSAARVPAGGAFLFRQMRDFDDRGLVARYGQKNKIREFGAAWGRSGGAFSFCPAPQQVVWPFRVRGTFLPRNNARIV
jgi:hypothetical protein